MGSTKASYTEHTVRTLEEHMDKGAFVKIKGPQEEKAGHRVRENTHTQTQLTCRIYKEPHFTAQW